MKKPIFGFAIFTLFALPSSGTDPGETVIPNGYSLNSPDRRFTVSVQYDHLNFRDNQNQHLNPRVGVLAPIHYLKWTGDSRTLVTVGHIAEGSLASLIHYASGTWMATLADPSNDPPFKRNEVVGVDVRQKHVRFLYETALSRWVSGRWDVHYYLCSFLVDPDSGHHSDIAKQEIDLPRYLALKRKWWRALAK